LPASVFFPRPWRRRRTVGWVVLVLVVVLVGAVDRYYAGQGGGDDWARYHDRCFAVAKVVDGDTLDVAAPDGRSATTRIRLWGVDTPELARGDGGAMYFGPEAGAFAERMLDGQTVRLVLHPQRSRDKYGRLLAYVYLAPQGPMFNERLLEEGYAYADTRFAHPFKADFVRLEQTARRAGVGLWGGVTPGLMPEWRRRLETRGRKG